MVLAVTLAVGLNSALAALVPADWLALTARLVRAADGNGQDVPADEPAQPGLHSARAAVLRAVVLPPAGVAPAIAHYTLGFADYRLASDPGGTGTEQRDFADEAERPLRDAVRLDDRFADAYGLLSATLGLKISWSASVETKMSMGPESSAAMTRALSLEPDNPRLLIVSGIA